MKNNLANARKLDKFFTRPDVVSDCISYLNYNIDTSRLNLWVEPSAGAGAFLDQLPSNNIALDIDPPREEGNRIKKADFLTWSYPNLNNIITIGNPPFGKNSALAVRFFNHASQNSSIIAFIVPRTFQKDSLQSRLNEYFHLSGELVLPADSFTFFGENYDVPCVFQIWERKDYKRKPVERKNRSDDFHFVKREEAHFAFQRVGARAGKIYSTPDQFSWRSPSSHYFIKDCTLEKKVHKLLRKISWEEIKSRTAGNPSIAKSELIREYEAIAA